jgi:hypothetical protein
MWVRIDARGLWTACQGGLPAVDESDARILSRES